MRGPKTLSFYLEPPDKGVTLSQTLRHDFSRGVSAKDNIGGVLI